MSLLTSVLVYSRPSMPSRTYKRKGASSIFNTVSKRFKGFTGLKGLGLHTNKREDKSTIRKTKQLIEDLSVAVKSEDPDALVRYFDRFDDAEIQALCKALQLPAKSSKTQNVNNLVKKLKSKKNNIILARQIHLNRLLELFFLYFSIRRIPLTLLRGHELYNQTHSSKRDSKAIKHTASNLTTILLTWPFVAFLASACHSNRKRLKQEYKLSQAELTNKHVTDLQHTIQSLHS